MNKIVELLEPMKEPLRGSLSDVRQILLDRMLKTGNEVGAVILPTKTAILVEGNNHTISMPSALHRAAVAIIHTHPHPLSFSLGDMTTFLSSDQLEWVEVIMPDGEVHRLTKKEKMSIWDNLYFDADLEHIYRSVADRWHGGDPPTPEEQLRRLYAVDKSAEAFNLTFEIYHLDKQEKV